MALYPGRGGAPGTYVYEDARAAEATRVSFNTTYMMVDVPDETSALVFPYNKPIQVNSLNEYENLIGTLDPTSYPELVSYYSVKAFFQQQANADLRVTRVGTPANIVELAFQPANKDNGVEAPSAVRKGDIVYLKIKINGIELGDRGPTNAWEGVPVEIPVNYVPGDTANNLAISNAMRNAAVTAIATNADISAGVYVRQVGSGDPSCDECSYAYLTGREYNATVEVIPSTERTGNQYVFASNAYLVQNVTQSDQTVNDWIQCAATAFDDPNLDQGYLCAPAAFAIYKQADRVNLGQSMEAVCADSNHKWMAVVDCGPYEVTRIEGYENFTNASPADGFCGTGGPDGDGLYLVDNQIYQWTDTDCITYASANYDAADCANSQNTVNDGDRVALKDDRQRDVSAADTTSDVLTLTAAWPTDVQSGDLVTLTIAESGGSSATPPTYTDAATSATDLDLVGSFYVIAADVDPALGATEIKVATSRARAFANTAVDITSQGSAVGGILLDLEYTTPAWEFEVDIKGKVSNVIEAIQSPSSSFNASHLPATLQDPTAQYDFGVLVKQLTNPTQAITRGGNKNLYFAASNVTPGSDQIAITAHGLSTGDSCFLFAPSDAAVPQGLTNNSEVFAIVVDADTIQLASSQANALAGTAITLSDAGTDSPTLEDAAGNAVIGVITTGNDALIAINRHGFSTSDIVMFDGDIAFSISNPTSSGNTFVASAANAVTQYFVKAIDENFFVLAGTSSDLAAGVAINLPTEGALSAITTTDETRVYRAMRSALDGDNLAIVDSVRWLRGRKYQMDVTMAVRAVMNELGTAAQDGGNDVSTDFRISEIRYPTDADYTFAYCEDETANCITDFAGENNFFCVPVSEGAFADADLTQQYFVPVLQIGTGGGATHTTLFGGDISGEIVDTDAQVPAGLYNFNAVTSADIIGEALRGVNNGGDPRVILVESGMDSHSRLFAESQLYSTTQGFLAYYAPYVLNDVNVYIPPSGFQTGLAMRRYRDEIAGFRLPPAGTKYSLAGARGVQVEITSAMQDVSNPRGLNALRTLPGYGETTVYTWGARTRINPEDPEQALYKFVNTRVIMNVIYGTIAQSLNDMIFNVIDGRAVTFNQIRSRVSNTLYSQFFTTGCLYGQRASDAFDVIVDDRNNPPANLENGLVNVQVFVVPVPTLERIEIDLIRVAIGQIRQTEAALGYGGFGYGNLNIDPNTGRASAFAI